MGESRVVIHPFESEVLKGNILNDPFVRRVAVYLPPEYDEKQRYPVVYMLTGFSGRGTMQLNENSWDENIQQRLDRLIRTGTIQPMIVVLPDCFTKYGGSQYLNSAGTGRYEDHVIEELVPWVDATWSTAADRDHRGVTGKSGGFGALTLGLRHPDVFGATASHSGDMYFELCYGPDIPQFLRGLKSFKTVENFLETYLKVRPRGRDWRDMINIVGMASCYSPNPSSAWGFDLPFDVETGEWKPEVWARWKEWDPIELVPQYEGAMRSQRLLYLDAGLRDEFNLQYGARTFCAWLKRRDIPYHYEEFDDGHMDITYRYDVSLKLMSDVFS